MPHLHIVLSEKDNAHLTQQVELSGLSRSALIRSLILQTELRPKPTQEALKILRELNAIGNNINQLARAANQGLLVNSDALDEIRNQLKQLLTMVKYGW